MFGCTDAETAVDPATCLLRPKIAPDALTSESAYEKWREDTFDWGKREEAQRYAGCLWLQKAGVKVACGPVPVGQ